MDTVEKILEKYDYDASVKAYKESKMVQMLQAFIRQNSLTY